MRGGGGGGGGGVEGEEGKLLPALLALTDFKKFNKKILCPVWHVIYMF